MERLKKGLSIAFSLSLSLALFACSVNVEQPMESTSTPNSAALASPTAISANDVTSPSPGPTSSVTWGGLELTGRLVYVRLSSNNDVSAMSVEVLNLGTGEVDTVFTAPEDAGIYYASVSPASPQLIISFSSPPSLGSAPNQVLYIMPLDGSAPPQLLVTPPTESDQYIQAEWSPDGKYVYYVHTNYKDRTAGQSFPNYEIFRMAYPGGQPEKIMDHAFWPRVSADSSELVYVTVDPVSGLNELFIADADGGNARQIDLAGANATGIVDAPLFSPDGQTIFFSAPSPAQSYQPNWFDKLTGVRIARAHNLASDWWMVPVTGGEPTRLTHIQNVNLFASISPDLERMVSFSLNGLFVMDLDGSNLTLLMPDPGGSTVNWIP